ncbi:hypothetical protein BGZ60DRAFT_91494 [Tricladium varicosporioides]|nr:hypothetical protein BGZ60DRAFT_91494 [Hymenoscyphus varicosporioides]
MILHSFKSSLEQFALPIVNSPIQPVPLAQLTRISAPDLQPDRESPTRHIIFSLPISSFTMQVSSHFLRWVISVGHAASTESAEWTFTILPPSQLLHAFSRCHIFPLPHPRPSVGEVLGSTACACKCKPNRLRAGSVCSAPPLSLTARYFQSQSQYMSVHHTVHEG